MIYIESGYNDGYMAHHARDIILVRIIHRPQDGYLLSHDNQVIREQLPLKDFIQRLRKAEGAQLKSLEEEMCDIERGLRERKERMISEWLDHRYSKVIKEKQAVLMEHTHSMNIRHVDHTNRLWNTEAVLKQQDQMGIKVKESVTDDEVYYIMTP